MLDDVLAMPAHLRDALWRVESARLEAADSAGLLVCGMGGSAIGGDLAAAALGERLTRPLATVRGYRLPCLGRRRLDGPLLELFGRDRGDARLLRGGDRGRRAADRRRHRRRPRRPRPRGGRPGRRPAGHPAAAGRGRLHVRRRGRGRRHGRGGAPDPDRGRGRRRPARAPGRRARGPLGGDRRAPGGHAAGDLRRRADGAAGAALEDPDQREREASRLLLRAARGRSQRDLRLGRAARGPAALGRHARRRRAAPALAPPLRADRGGDRRRRHRGGAGSRPRARRARRGSSRR